MLYIIFDFVSNFQNLFLTTFQQIFISIIYLTTDIHIYSLKSQESSLILHPSILQVHYDITHNSQMSESHVVDMVASRHALQLTHCSMSTSLFSQPYCAQCNGDNARGFANQVNGWKKLRKKTQFSLKGITIKGAV